MAALKTGGFLFFQTFTRNKLDRQGRRNPDYRLAGTGLLRLFAPLTPIFFQEHARIGDWQRGDGNKARRSDRNHYRS